MLHSAWQLQNMLEVLIVMALSAQSKAAKPQQQHAHVHGAARINIGVEGNGATVEFEAAADPVVGFEHKPKNAADQKQVDAALDALKARFAEIVILPAALDCKFTNTSAQLRVDGAHAEVHAEFQVHCAKPLQGAEIRFGVSKVYPEIEEVQVQVVSEGGQSGATIRKDKGSVKIG